jgi:Starch-binding associating with outer membrane
MKKEMKHNYIYALIAAIGLLLGGCADFLNVNTDPTRLKSSSMPLVLTGAQGNLAFQQGSDTFLYSTIFVQQMTGNGVTGSQTRFYDQWIVTNSDVNNAWSNYYAGPLADLDYIRKNTYAEGNPQYGGIAKVLQAYTFSTIVDAWGDVPYKESLKGVKNPQPKYDANKEIYDSLFVLIDAGIADLNKTNTRPIGTEDLFYGTSSNPAAQWIKFANTLKLRLALHYAKADAGAKLNALITAGGPFIGSNADNFQMAFENVTNRQNPLHQFEISRTDYLWPSNFLVGMMNTKNDPRRTTFFQPSPYPGTTASYVPLTTDTYVGFQPGAASGVNASRMGTYIRGAVTADNGARTGGNLNANSLTYTGAAPMRMLTFAEYNFIRAEAALIYGGAGSATTFFQAGIKASIDDAGLSGTAATIGATYGATTYPNPLVGPGDLQKIIEEKFVALYGVNMEAWSDWRRTGFPVLPANAAAAAQGNNTRPRILVYPLSETQVNSANMPARASGTVPSLFWDK